MTMQTLPRRLGLAIIVGVIVAVLSIKLNQFRDYQIAEIAFYVTAVAGLTVLTGLSGQISLGHAGFMAVGAYATALVLLHLNWPFYAALLVAAAVTAAAGAVVGVAAARLRGPYLAGATLMFGVAVTAIADAFPGVFGGDQGLNVTFTTPAFVGANFPPTRWLAWVSLVGGAGRSDPAGEPELQQDRPQLAGGAGRRCGGRARRHQRGRGAHPRLRRERHLRRDRRRTARHLHRAVAPGAFTITLSIALLTAAVIGGLGSLPGALWGSLLIVLVPIYVTDVATSHGLSSSVGANIPIVAYGVVLILVMLVFPQGIQGALRWVITTFFGTDQKSRTWRAAPAPYVTPSADELPASQHEKEGTS